MRNTIEQTTRKAWKAKHEEFHRKKEKKWKLNESIQSNSNPAKKIVHVIKFVGVYLGVVQY